jgi:hypothetical protein
MNLIAVNCLLTSLPHKRYISDRMRRSSSRLGCSRSQVRADTRSTCGGVTADTRTTCGGVTAEARTAWRAAGAARATLARSGVHFVQLWHNPWRILDAFRPQGAWRAVRKLNCRPFTAFGALGRPVWVTLSPGLGSSQPFDQLTFLGNGLSRPAETPFSMKPMPRRTRRRRPSCAKRAEKDLQIVFESVS